MQSVSRRSATGVLLLAGLLLGLLTIAAPARADLYDPADWAPSIWSDKADYMPGERVTLDGANWQPGETVNVVVNDDQGQTWRRDVDVTADGAGAITDSFDLPEHFVAVYSVRATGASSGAVATASFTDGNVKMAPIPSDYTFTVTRTLFNGAQCGGAPKSSSITGPSTGNGVTLGIGSSESARIDAAAFASAPNADKAFVEWTGDAPFTVIPGTNGRSICVDGNFNGSRDVFANYELTANAAPTVASDNASVSVDEGQTAANTGTYSDTNSGDTVAITASRGTVTKTGTNSGTWSWSLDTNDGPAQTGPVTITANDGNGGVTTSFDLTVANVAPSATFNAPASVAEGSAIALSLTGASDPSSVDTTAGFTYAFDCGSGYGSFGASSSASCPTTDNGSRAVAAKIRDTDGGVREYTATVSITNVAPSAAFEAPTSVDEGDAIGLALTGASDPSSVDTTAGFEYAFDCGGGSGYGAFGSSSSASCPTNDDGSRSVKGKVRDKDGGVHEYQATVTVANVAPAVTGPDDQSSGEGEDATFELGSFTDPGDDGAWAVTVDWGDGSADTTFTEASPGAIADKSHTYADNGTYTVTVTVAESGSGSTPSGSASFEVAVANVAPAVTAPDPQTADEGASTEFDLGSFSDPGDDGPWSVTIDWGDGSDDTSFTEASPGAIASKSHTYADDGTYTVTVTVAEAGDGPSDSATFGVTVSNVAPKVNLTGPGTAEEGETKSYSFTVTDPGADTWDFADGYPTCGEHGDLVAGSLATTASGGRFDCEFADGPADTDVSVRVEDSDGAASVTDAEHVEIVPVSVANVAPVVTAPLAQSADEGEDALFDLGTFSDPGADAPWSVSVDWGDGSADTDFSETSAGAIAGKSHTYADDGLYTVTVTVTEAGSGPSDAESFTVTVGNVAPVVTAPDPQSADEGSSTEFDLGSFSDPGADGPWSVTVDWGDGSSPETFTEASPGAIADKSHTYAGDATYTVTVTVAEAGEGTPPSDSNTFEVTVANVAPVVTAAAAQGADEGTSAQFDLGSFTDPGADGPWAVTVDWGDGSSDTSFTEAAPGSIAAKSHTYADNGTYTVTVTVAEAGSGSTPSDSKTFQVTVANVDPVITAPANQTADEGTGTEIDLGSFTDPGADGPWSVTVDWGDGSDDTSFTEASPGAIADKSHSYADNGTYTVTVTVAEAGDGPADSATFAIDVANVAPKVNLTGPGTAEEGETKSYSFTVTDPGADTWGFADGYPTCGSNGELVDGSVVEETSGGSFDCRFPDGPADTNVSVRVTDDDGATSVTDAEHVEIVAVEVANIAPAVTAPEPQSSDEGEDKTFDLGSFTDPGDDGPWAVTVDWGDGTTPATFTEDAAGDMADHNHTYADDGSFQVTVTVQEAEDGPSDSESFQVTVANVAPAVTAAGAQSSAEGESKTFDLGSFSDPGDDGPWSVTVDWGDGSASETFTEASPGAIADKSHTYADDATYTVTVAVAEAGGAPSDSATFEIDVANVTPVVTAPEPQSADEGTSTEFDLGSFADPGADGPWAVTVDWGDGTADTTFTEAAAGSIAGKPHTYADNGPYTVTVTVAEEGENAPSDSKTFQVMVANVAPKVNLTGPATVDEGQTRTYSFAVTDPGADDWHFTSAEYPTCGENGILVAGSVDETDGGGSFDCHFPDGDTTTNVAVRVTDEDGANSVADAEHVEVVEVTVVNVAPAVTPAADQSADEGENKSFALGSFTDPGPDGPWSVTVDWGDGSTDTTFTQAAPGELPAKSHAYGDNRSYTVAVTVAEAGTGTPASDTRTFVADVANVNPTAVDPEFAIDPFTGVATASFAYSDAGWRDTHADSLMTWTAGTGLIQTVTRDVEVAPNPITGRVTGTQKLDPACYALTVAGTAEDDDDGLSGEVTIASNRQTGVHGRGFRPPMAGGERNVAKWGNVVPVKVQLTNSCTNAAVTDARLYLTWVKGLAGDDVPDDTNPVLESVSNADTGNQMRIADGMYIYNLSTKGLQAGSDYTLRVRLGDSSGPILLRGVLYPKK